MAAERILVTGGAGYIGSHVAHALCELGRRVIVVDDLSSGHGWAVPESAIFIEGDVGDRALLDRLFEEHRVRTVMHFAAHIQVGESVLDPEKYYRNNTSNSLEVFSSCREHGVERVVFSSTAAVYGDAGDESITENSKLDPVSPYGRSKLMSEQILSDLAAASKDRMRFAILRYFNASGARADLRVGQATANATHLIKVACQAALGVRDEVRIFGDDFATRDGTGERDYVHVADLAEAHIDALTYLESAGRSDVFNIGYGLGYSVREVLDSVRRVSGRDFKVIVGSRRAGDPSRVVADSEKAKRVLGWRPRHESLDEICGTAYRWEESLQDRRGFGAV